jgi:hypothetical protein
MKSCEIRPDAISGPEALAIVIADLLLIRRPLIQVGGPCVSGFDSSAVHEWIGLRHVAVPLGDQCACTVPRKSGSGSAN